MHAFKKGWRHVTSMDTHETLLPTCMATNGTWVFQVVLEVEGSAPLEPACDFGKRPVGLVSCQWDRELKPNVKQKSIRSWGFLLARWYRYCIRCQEVIGTQDMMSIFTLFFAHGFFGCNYCQLVGGSLTPTVACFPDVAMLLGPRGGGGINLCHQEPMILKR